MPHEFRTTRRVEFADTDMAGIAHFANFFRWMEAAEHEFFRSLGHSVHGDRGGVEHGFVRVSASCDYQRAARYEDVLDVRLVVREKRSKSLTYDFEFRAAAGASAADTDAKPLATGRLSVVCVARDPDEGRLRAVAIPEDLADRLEVAP